RVEPTAAGAPPVVTRRLVRTLPPALVHTVVPHLNTVHDRGVIEVMRGCPRGCRFCQAGHTYRPVRLRKPEEIMQAVDDLLACTGYEEVSLLSLSTGDYPHIEDLVQMLGERHQNVNFSLPSLRIDSFSVALAESVHRKKTSLTFAPEAGTQRLRDVIHKQVTEDDLLRAVEAAYGAGWSTVKLYFMIGLPTETPDDIAGIGRLIGLTLDIGRRVAGRRAQVNASVATFVPKPQTPFQWSAQNTREELEAKLQHLRANVRRGVHLAWHDPETSLLEAALARGDRRLGAVILAAWRAGCRFDAWSDHFRPELWQRAAEEVGLDLAFYAQRVRELEEVLPWAHIRSGARPEYLRRQYELAMGQAGESAEKAG
ncbi:MAG: radical SAM protein, partial [Chloroflexota bacterium]